MSCDLEDEIESLRKDNGNLRKKNLREREKEIEHLKLMINNLKGKQMYQLFRKFMNIVKYMVFYYFQLTILNLVINKFNNNACPAMYLNVVNKLFPPL